MCCDDIHVLGVISWKTKGTVYLLFTRENRKFRLENQMVHIISFRRLQKIWVVIWDDAINLFFYPFQSVQLIWIYFVVGRSPTTSNLIDLFFCTRFPPRWFVYMVHLKNPTMQSKINQSKDFIGNIILLHE